MQVGIFALRNIKAGEELTYDYHFNHFGHEGATSFVCRCGAPQCRGTLDADPEKSKHKGRWGTRTSRHVYQPPV